MSRKFAILMSLFIVLSCQKETTPKGVLTKPQMVDWMIDVYLAEARANSLPIPRDSIYKLFMPYQDSLKKRKGIQDSVFRKSYQYYLANPVELEAIYDVVIDSLNLREQRMRKASPDIP